MPETRHTKQARSPRNRLSSVANAARVLKSFSASNLTWGVADLAAHLSLSTSSTHRILSTLADEGILDQDPATGRYRMGLTAFDMVAAMPKQRTLHEAVLVSMTELRARTGETVQVGVLDGREVVYVERLESPHTLRVFTELGRRAPAHRTGSGKAILAFLPARQRESLLDDWQLDAATEYTITNIDDLREQIRVIRRIGYAENRQESELGVVSVAAPIRNETGSAVASLSLAGPSERMDPNRVRYAEAVMIMARAVSLQMGWRG